MFVDTIKFYANFITMIIIIVITCMHNYVMKADSEYHISIIVDITTTIPCTFMVVMRIRVSGLLDFKSVYTTSHFYYKSYM